MQHREALDVRLVDDGLIPRRLQQPVALPVKSRVDHQALGHRVGVVVVVGLEVRRLGVVGDVRQRAALLPLHLPVDRLRVRVDQELVRVEAVPALRVVGPMDAVAVALAGTDTGQIAVPVERGALDDLDALLVVVGVVQAQLHALGVLAEDAEVRALAVPCRAQREGPAGPDVAVAHRSSAPVIGASST